MHLANARALFKSELPPAIRATLRGLVKFEEMVEKTAEEYAAFPAYFLRWHASDVFYGSYLAQLGAELMDGLKVREERGEPRQQALEEIESYLVRKLHRKVRENSMRSTSMVTNLQSIAEHDAAAKVLNEAEPLYG